MKRMKRMKRIAVASLLPMAFCLAAPAIAGDMPSQEEMWEMIKEQQTQIKELKERLEGTSAPASAPSDEALAARVKELEATVEKAKIPEWIEKMENGKMGALPPGVEISGLIEVEANQASDYADVNTSDITLATVELAIDAKVNSWTKGHLLLKYTEDDNSNHIFMDEGYITIGDTDRFPLYTTVGRQYVPFVQLDSNMITDSLTLSMAETSETAILAGVDFMGAYAKGYVFNGDTKANGRDNVIGHAGVTVGYAIESDDNKNLSLDVGVGYINNIADSGGITSALASSQTLNSQVAGYSAHATVGFRGFQIIGEYVTADKPFDEAQLSWTPRANGGAEPSAYHTELAYTFDLAGRETTVALGAQGTDEALALALPETRFMISTTMEVLPKTFLALEYYKDEDYEIAEGGTGKNGHTATMKLGVEF